MPALQLPEEVAAVLRSYYTCEVTTVNAKGQPMTWPALAYFDEATGEIFFSVSIAFPVKAQNARKRPQVSLLYSDPTGSGLDHAPAVLVQGDATVAEILKSTPHARSAEQARAASASRIAVASWPVTSHAGCSRGTSSSASGLPCVHAASLSGPIATSARTPSVIEVAESEAADVE